MSKIWNEVFWTNEPDKLNDPEEFTGNSGPIWMMIVPVIILVSLTIIIGLFAAPFFQIAVETADQLLNPQIYIETVLKPVR
jgi:multicomponent Na+:H+ antiporter subunit D